MIKQVSWTLAGLITVANLSKVATVAASWCALMMSGSSARSFTGKQKWLTQSESRLRYKFQIKVNEMKSIQTVDETNGKAKWFFFM